jgi:sn-glycerol 3-phosphate transport system substrate-binding protein
MEAEGVDVTDYQDSLINEGYRQDQYWWIPFARSTPLFYYNKEKWAAAGLPDRGPETWDEYKEWAEQLVVREGDKVTVSAFVHPDGASYIAWLFQGVVWQFGGKYSDPDFTMHMTDENTIRAGQFYYDTVHTYGWAVPSTDMPTDFINGFTAAAMMSTGDMGGIKKNATFDFGTAFLPKETNFGCSTGGAGLAILTSCPEEERQAAMKYIAFASSPEQTTFWSKNTGYMPVRKSALESAEMQAYFEEFPQFKTAAEQLPLTHPQDAARVFVPTGDPSIGAGLERITVQSDDVATAFADVQAILEEEAAPVIESLRAVEG